MTIKSGRYIITNAEYWNFVFLSDNSDGSSLQACLKEDVPGQEFDSLVCDIGCSAGWRIQHRL
jgi:hypothetical protein